MIDPVSEELERRSHLDLRWRWAVAGALGIHAAVAVLLFLGQAHGRRALTLPRIQVRIAAALPLGAAAASRPAPAAPAPPARRAAETPAKKAKPRSQAEPPPRHAIPDKQSPRPAEKPPAAQRAGAESAAGAALPAPGTLVSASGGIALGAASVSGEEPFPFTYYLNRVLALVEGNWFRPPATGGTSCRVRCVIDRSGRLVEAGLESESQTPAFDRAALRAVYASAPFPPLPQSFGGSTLTLHLEFGP